MGFDGLGYYNDTDHHFDGHLDDVSIYARALSDSEIENLSDNQAGRYEYHHTNALGSNIVLTDDSQNVLVRYEYDVFGAIRSEVGTTDNVRKLTGKEWDADVNLYYYAARYYDPYVARFTQRDPAQDGINWYAYANNKSKNQTDFCLTNKDRRGILTQNHTAQGAAYEVLKKSRNCGSGI